MAEPTTFEVDSTTYELVYAEKRLEMAENAMGNKSIISVFNNQPTLRETKTILAYGIRESGQSAWVNPTRAIEIAGKYLVDVGYAPVVELMSSALMRDCGFLFRQI